MKDRDQIPAERRRMALTEFNLIRAALERGMTFVDMAEPYGPFVDEQFFGKAPAPTCEQVVIAAKFGFDIDQTTGERRAGLNSRPDRIKGVGEASLKRFRADVIDIFQSLSRRQRRFMLRRPGRIVAELDQWAVKLSLEPVGLWHRSVARPLNSFCRKPRKPDELKRVRR